MGDFSGHPCWPPQAYDSQACGNNFRAQKTNYEQWHHLLPTHRFEILLSDLICSYPEVPEWHVTASLSSLSQRDRIKTHFSEPINRRQLSIKMGASRLLYEMSVTPHLSDKYLHGRKGGRITILIVPLFFSLTICRITLMAGYTWHKCLRVWRWASMQDGSPRYAVF